MESIKRIKNMIEVSDFVINFSYETKRRNKKEQKRVVKAPSINDAEMRFKMWLMTYNEDFSYRAMLNVKILSIEKINTSYINL